MDPSSPLSAAPLTNRQTAADQVAEALREAIASGRLLDGAVLNQVAIAQHFNVSRVPVREAMRLLEAEGLIEASAHRSPVVRTLSPERVVELYELRALIEGHLVELATPHVDAATLDRLTELNRAMGETSPHAAWLDINAEFHRRLYAPARRPESMTVLEHIRLRTERYVQLWSSGKGMVRADPAVHEHARIIELVRAGDAAGARDAVTAHVHQTAHAIRALRDEG